MRTQPRRALSALALLLLASCAAAAGRRLLQAQNATGCGALGAPCCELATGAGSSKQVCTSADLYCLAAAPAPGAPPEAPLVVSCRPVPQGCGRAGAECCPGSQPCRDAGTACVLVNQTAFSMQEPGATVCRRFEADSCGRQGGPCAGTQGTWPAGPLAPCPPDRQQCGDGLYCERPIADLLGTCKAVPQGCGEREGGACCPPGFYGGPGGRNTSAPFCRGGGGGSMHCAGPLGAPVHATCVAWPAFPDACGKLGAPCCPDPASWLEDSGSPPPECEDGAECTYRSDGGGTCTPAPPCGEEGQPCCRTMRASSGGSYPVTYCRGELPGLDSKPYTGPAIYCRFQAEDERPTCRLCAGAADNQAQASCAGRT